MLNKLKQAWLVLLAVPLLLLGGVFYTNVGALRVTGGNTTYPSIFRDPGAFLFWNISGGFGETDLVNQNAGASGGFNFYNQAPNSALGSPIFQLSPNGTGTFLNGIVATNANLSGNIAMAGSISGASANFSRTGTFSLGVTAPNGIFGYVLADSGAPGLLTIPGAYMGWNQAAPGFGETDFIDEIGTSVVGGGWYWFTSTGSAPGTLQATLTPSTGFSVPIVTGMGAAPAINNFRTISLATYSAAGTGLPSCGSATNGQLATVSDANGPTYMGVYASGGAITASVICSYNGSAYAWRTH